MDKLNEVNRGGDVAQLIFRFNRPVPGTSRILEPGKLKLVNGNEGLAFSATSGLAGFQNLGASNQRGKGRIPSCLQAKIISYKVSINPVWLPDTKGVNGNFYPISPFVVQVGQQQRSDLGIHADRNIPGSAGCIVITIEDHWKQFQVQMESLRKQDIISIDLLVF